MEIDPKENRKILLEFAKFELDGSRHHEVQRERMTNMFLVVSGLLFASVGWDREITSSDLSTGILIILVGLYGPLFSLKHYYRFKMHYERYRGYRDAIDSMTNGIEINEIRLEQSRKAEQKHRYPWMIDVPLHMLWSGLLVLVACLGTCICIQALGST